MRTTWVMATLLGVLACAGWVSDDDACQTYDPTKIQVIPPNSGPFANSAWKIESAGAPLEQAANQADADRVAALTLFYSVECKIVSKRPSFPTITYWKQPTRPLALPFPEECVSYDPAKLSEHVDGLGGTVGDLEGRQLRAPVPFFLRVPGQKEADAVLALARQWTTACVIGGWQPAETPEMLALATQSQDAKRQLEDLRNAWHPVYYWKK